MNTNTNIFKERLASEKAKLEGELETIGRKNPSDPQDWEGTIDEENTVDAAEEGELSDAIDTFETNTALTEELETRLDEVTAALEQIEEGTYGTCKVCGAEIEEDRLNANPAAATCKVHMDTPTDTRAQV